jgi:oxalate decarboxylase/phosphoglucose isomerase-like protein (cupin superfamily)
MADRFEDDRGIIQDLLGPVDAVTEIFTRAGSIRGNHVHLKTTQWAYIAWGKMRFVTQQDDGIHSVVRGPGSLIVEPASIPHAWEAIEDTLVLVFTRGPRSGEAYESDTLRLDTPLIIAKDDSES